jgi:hypothetical protein
MTGLLTLPGMVVPTPNSAVKARLGGLPNVPAWAAFTINAQYTPSGWLLDDPSTYGMFFKLDVRAPNDNFAVYRIPPGAGAHTDETNLLTMDNNTARITIAGVLSGVGNPGQANDAANRGYVDARAPHMVVLTQAEYDALPTKDPATVYVVT